MRQIRMRCGSVMFWCAIAVWPAGGLACGEQEPDGGIDDTDQSTDSGSNALDYFPMSVGNRWEYKETDPSSQDVTLVYEVTDFKTVHFEYGNLGDREVFEELNTLAESPQEKRIQYVEDDGRRATRLQHKVWDKTGVFTKQRDYVPGFLRFDRSKIKQGTKWTEQFVRYTDIEPEDDTNVVNTEDMAYEFEILSEHETITVEAGTFDCLKLQRYTLSEEGDPELKFYFFAADVGKVKEITGTKVEDLVAYTIAE